MSSPVFLSPADAARRLGVSAKALRLYEERGLIAPGRTQAGWRAYGPEEMERAASIAALRTLGLSLAQIARVLRGDAADLVPALASHQATLETQLGNVSGAIAKVHKLRERISAGEPLQLTDLTALQSQPAPVVSFDLPWPWGSEIFELRQVRPLTWITGPLFSGKTRLAEALAANIPGAVFIDLDRTPPTDAQSLARLAPTLEWLIEDGATRSDALLALLHAIELEEPTALIIDLVEQGLDAPTQLALAAWLRQRGPNARPIFAMTRSSAMLDFAAVTADEAILLCPANHSPPVFVAPHAGAPGYEATAMCLAAPEVRARTEGVIAIRPPAA